MPWRNAHPFATLVLDLNELDVCQRLYEDEKTATKFV